MFEVASVNCHYRKLFLQDIFQLTQIQWRKSVLYLSFMRNEAFGEVVEINRYICVFIVFETVKIINWSFYEDIFTNFQRCK